MKKKTSTSFVHQSLFTKNDNSAISGYCHNRSVLKRFRFGYRTSKYFIARHSSINSIKNKCDLLEPVLMLDIDNLMVTEADYFPTSQFETESFNTAFRLD